MPSDRVIRRRKQIEAVAIILALVIAFLCWRLIDSPEFERFSVYLVSKIKYGDEFTIGQLTVKRPRGWIGFYGKDKKYLDLTSGDEISDSTLRSKNISISLLEVPDVVSNESMSRGTDEKPRISEGYEIVKDKEQIVNIFAKDCLLVISYVASDPKKKMYELNLTQFGVALFFRDTSGKNEQIFWDFIENNIEKKD